MHPTLLVLLAGALLMTAAFALRLKRRNMPVKCAFAALPLSLLLGFALGKCVYVLCLITRLLPRYGFSAFLRMELTEFSFLGIMAGMLLGTVIACKICKVRILPVLDAYAPSFALFAAFVKGSEYFLDMHGVGAYLENESFFFFPLAVKNEWDEYFLAVFMIYAILALVIALLAAVFSNKTQHVPGVLFEVTVYQLAVVLILCENLRAQTITWGFVKAEQLLGALICLVVLIRSCWAYPRKTVTHSDGPTSTLVRKNGKLQDPNQVSPIKRFWPIPAIFACAGLLIMVIFALDGKIPAISNTMAYVIMALTLTAMCALGLHAARRRIR